MGLVYHFVFDHNTNPTRVQIYPEARKLGITLSEEWILDFEGQLDKENTTWPGSVVWKRPSYVFGNKTNEYALVQVMDETGKRIDPAWSEFVKYQASEAAGSEP